MKSKTICTLIYSAPEHIHFTQNERIAFKYPLDNGYEAYVNTQKIFPYKSHVEKNIDDYKRRIKEIIK